MTTINTTFRIYEDEEEFEKEKNKLFERIENCAKENLKEFSRYEINWIDFKYDYRALKNNNTIKNSESPHLLLLAHSNDIIRGKPQLIHQTIQRIPMLRRVEKKYFDEKEMDWKVDVKFKYIDDRFDRRYDGNEKEVLAFDFFIYRVIDNSKEYYVFSTKKLREEYSEFLGMKINLDDISDLNSSLKIKKIACIFLAKESRPYINVLSRYELIEFTKELKEKYHWDTQGFKDYIFSHPDNKIYEYSEDFNNLRIAQLLSSKYEGYPLHIMKMGPVGTGKTTEAEVLDAKFGEEQGILEAGTSRMKSLVPSFKEKPANLGYICNCNRIAIIDELMKMIGAVAADSHQNIVTYLGELNMILEQKRRMVGSGNDNSTIVKSTAKVCITTNPLPSKTNIYQHLSMVDPTTISRLLVWIQDKEECEIIYSKSKVRTLGSESTKTSPEHIHNPDNNFSRDCVLDLYSCDSVRGKNDAFLTIYDSCQEFLVDFDEAKVNEAFQNIVVLTKDPMKQVWKSRGLHHTILILDGLVKYRCLFQDYDPHFTPKEEDYIKLNKILLHMVHSWDTNFSNNNWEDLFK